MSVVLWPLQMVVSDALAVTTGCAPTFTVMVVESEQPLCVPATVYVMVEEGETMIGFALPPPEFALHVYVLAPAAVSVVLCPVQILKGLAVTVKEGSGVTFSATVCVAVQVPPLSPVTVYTVVLAGATVSVAAVPPVLQV